MSAQPVTFDQYFWDQAGRPVPVTSRSIPDGIVFTTSVATGTLLPNSSFNILLFDSGQPLQVAWSSIEYNSTNARLGGFAIFRSKATGRTDFEALVPLSSIDDRRFYMPFDNLEGFVTSMAILNPGNIATQAQLTFRSTKGELLAVRTLNLPPGNQVAFVIPQEFPETRGRAGAVYVEGSTQLLSGLGFRFGPGGAFATIPIMNWVGILQ